MHAAVATCRGAVGEPASTKKLSSKSFCNAPRPARSSASFPVLSGDFAVGVTLVPPVSKTLARCFGPSVCGGGAQAGSRPWQAKWYDAGGRFPQIDGRLKP